jgi:hypothetical protein
MTHSFELPRSFSLLERWGHYSPQLLSAAIAGAIALGVRPMEPSLALVLTALGLLAFVLVTWALMRQHDRRLCESCAAAIPLNAAEQSARYRRRFWLAHSGSNPWYLLPYLALLVGSNFFTGSVGRLVWAVVQASMIYLIMAHSTHRRLQPWCPWCSDDGGGDPVSVWEPDGPRGDRRQLV